MNYYDYDQEELNSIAIEFIRLQNKAKKSKSKKVINEYKKYQNYCMEKFRWLINSNVAKYKKFNNFEDLQQDAFIALLNSLVSYNPKKKVDFTWWANQYICTRISRRASCHSTIRIPLKKAKENKPFKTDKIPNVIDTSPSATEVIESGQRDLFVLKAVEDLSADHQKVLTLAYGLNTPALSVGKITKELNISRSKCLSLLSEAETELKKKLSDQLENNL